LTRSSTQGKTGETNSRARREEKGTNLSLGDKLLPFNVEEILLASETLKPKVLALGSRMLFVLEEGNSSLQEENHHGALREWGEE